MRDTLDKELCFVIPTHRLREVGATIEVYDEHFWRNGHSPRLIVFDDSTPVNQRKYFPLLEQTRTHQPVDYVGPAEKEQFLAYLNHRLRGRRLETLVRNLFRPSYGGNRNCTLMYTLGGLMISSDDDMRPYSFVEYSPESLSADEVCRGRLHHASEDGYTQKSFDIVAAFVDVLGRRVGQIPDNYERGELPGAAHRKSRHYRGAVQHRLAFRGRLRRYLRDSRHTAKSSRPRVGTSVGVEPGSIVMPRS